MSVPTPSWQTHITYAHPKKRPVRPFGRIRHPQISKNGHKHSPKSPLSPPFFAESDTNKFQKTASNALQNRPFFAESDTSNLQKTRPKQPKRHPSPSPRKGFHTGVRTQKNGSRSPRCRFMIKPLLADSAHHRTQAFHPSR